MRNVAAHQARLLAADAAADAPGFNWSAGTAATPGTLNAPTITEAEKQRTALGVNRIKQNQGVDAGGILNGIRAAIENAKAEAEAAMLRARFELQDPLARGRRFLSQFKEKKETESKSVSVLDARFASQQFGGRREELDTLKKIEGHTKKAADKDGGIPVA